MKNRLQEFRTCLHEKRYYDAHEALEAVWFPRRFENSNEIKLLKGFINAAVSFELRKRGRRAQSKRVWANYLKYRPNLYRVSSLHLNEYHALARELETLNHTYL